MKIFSLILLYRCTSGVGYNDINPDLTPNSSSQIPNDLKRSISTAGESDCTSCKKEKLTYEDKPKSEVASLISDKNNQFFKLIANLVSAILYHRNELDLMIKSLNAETDPILLKSADIAAFIDIAVGFFDKSSIPKLKAEYAKCNKEIELIKSKKCKSLKPKKAFENKYDSQLLMERSKKLKSKI